ncbi:unnamed protein product [Linum tenue]|uniref:Cytochrome P450 n=1 Tax=Linum tenue TaxID=586396 RepID=A0AAV0QQJ5_9ROSI|nr:unnamed protein product [Linum tenue]
MGPLHYSLLILPSVLILSTYYLLLLLKRRRSPSPDNPPRLPPSPPALPVIGNLHQVGLYPHRTFAALAQRYAAPVMLLRLGSKPALLVSTAGAARELFKSHDLLVSTRMRIRTFERLFYDAKTVASAPHGEYWRHARATCVLHLLSNKKVHSFAPVRIRETELMVERIADASRRGVAVDLSDVATCLSNDVICRVSFGDKMTSDPDVAGRFKVLLEELMKLLGGFFVGDFIPSLGWVNRLVGVDRRVDKTFKEFDEMLESILVEHEDRSKDRSNGSVEEGCQSFVDVLLEAQRDGKTTSHFLGRDNIKALLMDMLVGGTDTSATLLEWVMAELLKHPRVMKKLQHEVRTITKGKLEISDSDLDQMTYLKQVMLETLRLHPPVPLLGPRELIEDSTIMGYELEAGTLVFTNAWAIGRDPRSWDEPEEFRPERFTNGCLDRGQDFDVIPFGAGRRGCPGRAFALAINELVVANLVGRFDWTLPDGIKTKDLDMNECALPTIHRRYHLRAMAITI